MELEKIDDKAVFEDAYYAVRKCAEEFNRHASNFPVAHKGTVAKIYERYDEALCSVFRASNTYDLDIKLTNLHIAHECLFYQQSSFDLFFTYHVWSLGQANNTINLTREAYIQVNKWYNSVIKKKAINKS